MKQVLLAALILGAASLGAPLTVVTPGMPFRRTGIPWYWVLSWQASSGRMYEVPIVGFSSPFSP